MAFCTSCGSEVKGTFCAQCGAPAPGSGAQAPQQPAAFPTPAVPVAPAVLVASKTSPLVWVLVAVVGLFVLGGIVVVGGGFFLARSIARNPEAVLAKIITATNPDAEVVRTDTGARQFTIRDKRTGQEVTMSFDDVKNGRLKFSAIDEQGKTAHLEIGGAAKLPSWVPAYPGASLQAGITGSGNDGDSAGEGGMVTFTTADAPSKVMSFYQDKCKELGMKVELTTATSDGGMMTAVDDDGQRTIHVMVGSGSGIGSAGTITYGKKR